MSNKNKSDLLKSIDRLKAEDRMSDFLAEVEGHANEPSDDLVQRTSERIRSAIREFDARESVAATAALSSSWLSVAFEKLSDVYAALSRLELVDTHIGNPARGLADDGARRSAGGRSVASHFCTWRQDAVQLTLSCLPRKPHTVTLHVDEGPDLELSELRWIDEDHLLGEPDRSVEMHPFPLKQLPDERTYLVDMDVVTFQARMGAINAAREDKTTDGVDVRLLLPFVR